MLAECVRTALVPARALVCSLVSALITAGASADGWQPVHDAAEGGNVEALRERLDSGAPVDLRTAAGFTPLYLSVQSDLAAAATLLLDRGADPAARLDGWTLLHVAAANDSAQAAKVLLDRGAELDAYSANGLSPLRVAVLGGHAATAQLLLESGAACPGDLLALAAERGHASVVRVLLGAPNHTQSLALAAGVAATANDRASALEVLLDAGLAADSGQDGSSLLHVAARHDRPATAELLLARGAKLETRDADAATPLYRAAESGSNRVARLLLLRGADPNAPNKDGATPLYISAFLGNAPLAEDLIARGAEVDRRAIDASTTLHLAARKGHVDVAETLLEHGATLDARDFESATPLHTAAREGRAAMVEFLISRGADPRALTNDGKTPADVAQDEAVRAVLRRVGDST